MRVWRVRVAREAMGSSHNAARRDATRLARGISNDSSPTSLGFIHQYINRINHYYYRIINIRIIGPTRTHNTIRVSENTKHQIVRPTTPLATASRRHRRARRLAPHTTPRRRRPPCTPGSRPPSSSPSRPRGAVRRRLRCEMCTRLPRVVRARATDAWAVMRRRCARAGARCAFARGYRARVFVRMRVRARARRLGCGLRTITREKRCDHRLALAITTAAMMSVMMGLRARC